MEGLYEEPYRPRTEELTAEVLLNEIAFHEASHFVFQALITNCTDDFSIPSGIETIISNDGIPQGQVIGFNCRIFEDGLPNTVEQLYSELCEFYAANKHSAVLELFSLMSGYSSYQVFVEPGKPDFIALPKHEIVDGQPPILKSSYYDLEHAPPSRGGIKDLFRIRHLLRCLSKGDDYLEIVKRLTDDIIELMNIQCVNDSIRFVRNQLLEKKNKGRIENEKLINMWNKVKRLTGNVSLSEAISRRYRDLLE